MHCKPTRKLLFASLEHPLDTESERVVQAHIAECTECRRFAEAMHMWPAHAAAQQRRRGAPDLTERVLAHVRPLPPPWVYRQEQQSKQVPHLIAFVVGALGVSLTFLMLCLTFVVAVAGSWQPTPGRQRLFVPEVWKDVQVWMNGVPNDHAHAIVTALAALVFITMVVAWFRTLSAHVGRDRQ
ncbi:MAG: zf-HC2 domain-containing protein [Thermomicrobia bacterium]|nr:zf-HC2 domain-containing protein [Thermomicrobia bacterium]